MTAPSRHPAPLAGLDASRPAGSRRLSRRPVRRDALLVLPRVGAARMLVPADVGSAHQMLHRHVNGKLQRVGQEVVAAAQRSGLLGLLPLARLVPAGDGPAIEHHVRAQVPEARRVGVLLGPPRANAKPVLQVFDGRGRTIAFGKLGHTPASAALVGAETAVLRELASRRLARVEVPTVLSDEPWQGMPLLLMTALSASQQRASSWDLPLEAMHEVADEPGATLEPIAGGSYGRRLRSSLTGAAEPRLLDVLDRLEAAAGATMLLLGRWHGDWAPWNMAHAGRRVQVWDWERSVTGVPVGLDVVHFQVQLELRNGAAPAAAVAAAEAALARGGSPWGLGPDQVTATVVLYLLEVWHRYTSTNAPRTPALTRRLATIEQMADVALHEHWRT